MEINDGRRRMTVEDVRAMLIELREHAVALLHRTIELPEIPTRNKTHAAIMARCKARMDRAPRIRRILHKAQQRKF